MKPRTVRQTSKVGKKGTRSCAHLSLELERSTKGYFTGFYVCRMCGAQVIVNALDDPSTSEASSKKRSQRPPD